MKNMVFCTAASMAIMLSMGNLELLQSDY